MLNAYKNLNQTQIIKLTVLYSSTLVFSLIWGKILKDFMLDAIRIENEVLGLDK